MVRLLALLLCIGAVPLLVQQVYARDVLMPITSCEEDEGDHLCNVAGLVLGKGGARSSIRRQVRGETMIKKFLISGKLNGGPPKPYTLTFSQPLSDYFASTNHSGPIAYDPGHDLVVRTNRGRLRILSKVQIEDPPNVVVIDERSWNVVARYYRPWIDLSFLRRRAPFWDEGRNTCVSMPSQGRAVTFAGTCTKPKRVAYYNAHSIPEGFERAVGTTTEKIDAAVRDLRTLRLQAMNTEGTGHGGQGWGVYAYRVTGTHILVLYGYCSDCDY